jgi:hypothetical protein
LNPKVKVFCGSTAGAPASDRLAWNLPLALGRRRADVRVHPDPAKSCPWDLVHIAAVREAIPRRNDSCATTPVVDHCLFRVAIDAE